MKYRKKLLSILLILSLFVGMAGIVNVDTAYAASKKKAKIMTKSVTLQVGESYQQKVLNNKGKAIKAKKVKWKSKNKSVATINKKGVVTAVRAGTANMTAKYKGKTYKFTVMVKKPAGPKSRVSLTYTIDIPHGCFVFFTDTIDVRLFAVSFSDPSIARAEPGIIADTNKSIRYRVIPLRNGVTTMTVTNTLTGEQQTATIIVSIPMYTFDYPYPLPEYAYNENFPDGQAYITSVEILDTYNDVSDYIAEQRVIVHVQASDVTLPWLPVKFYDENGTCVGNGYMDLTDTVDSDFTFYLRPERTGKVTMKIGD